MLKVRTSLNNVTIKWIWKGIARKIFGRAWKKIESVINSKIDVTQAKVLKN